MFNLTFISYPVPDSNSHQDLPDGRSDYNTPSNDPTSWSGYNTRELLSMAQAQLLAYSNAPVGQQSSFAAYDNDPRQSQYSYPAPQQIPYSSYPSRDQSSSYPINSSDSRILPPINVHNDRGYPGAYPSSSTNRPTADIYSPVATYPSSSYPQFPSQTTSDPRNYPQSGLMPGSSQSSGNHPARRTSLSVDRNSSIRSTVHATSPYARHPPQAESSDETPQVKKKRKRADADQLKVLNETYARTAFPSTEERQELATRLNMTPRSVQIWYVHFPRSSQSF